MTHKPRLAADLALAAITFIWGATFVLVKLALDDVSTLLFLALRFTLAALILAVALGPQLRQARDLRRSLRGGLLAGVLLFSGYAFQTFGLAHTTPSKAGFLTGLSIPLVPLLSALAYRTAPGVSEVLGVLAAGIGMALMTLQGGVLHMSAGDLLVTGGAIAFAFHILTIGHFTATSNVAVLSVTQIATSALIASAAFWWAEPIRISWTPRVWFALGITSIFATALAFSVQAWAQQHTSPTRTALIFSLEPVFAWLTSFVLNGELLTRRATFGALLILAGIFLVELKPQFRRPIDA